MHCVCREFSFVSFHFIPGRLLYRALFSCKFSFHSNAHCTKCRRKLTWTFLLHIVDQKCEMWDMRCNWIAIETKLLSHFITKIHPHFSLKNLSLIVQYVLCKCFFFFFFFFRLDFFFALQKFSYLMIWRFIEVVFLSFSVDFTYTNFVMIVYLGVCVCEVFFPMHTHTHMNDL